MTHLLLSPFILVGAVTALGLCIGGPLFLVSLGRHRLADWRYNRSCGR